MLDHGAVVDRHSGSFRMGEPDYIATLSKSSALFWLCARANEQARVVIQRTETVARASPPSIKSLGGHFFAGRRWRVRGENRQWNCVRREAERALCVSAPPKPRPPKEPGSAGPLYSSPAFSVREPSGTSST
jgi:hypothetical protein